MTRVYQGWVSESLCGCVRVRVRVCARVNALACVCHVCVKSGWEWEWCPESSLRWAWVSAVLLVWVVSNTTGCTFFTSSKHNIRDEDIVRQKRHYNVALLGSSNEKRSHLRIIAVFDDPSAGTAAQRRFISRGLPM